MGCGPSIELPSSHTPVQQPFLLWNDISIPPPSLGLWAFLTSWPARTFQWNCLSSYPGTIFVYPHPSTGVWAFLMSCPARTPVEQPFESSWKDSVGVFDEMPS